MESQHRKGFAVVIMAMVAVMLCWLLFWPTNLSLPRQLIIPFDPSHSLFMFLLCNIIILTITFTTQFWEGPRNFNGVTAYQFSPREIGHASCQNHHVIVSADSFCEPETPKSKNFICTPEYVGEANEKLGCRNDRFVCSSLSVPSVINSKRNKELASMIDEDFNRTVEEFIAEFKGQLHQQSSSRCRDVPTVIESKKQNDLASMIDEDFNNKVEEFIAQVKRQLHQQSFSPCRLHA